MHLRSSILLLIITMDGLQIQTTIYVLFISCPLYSFVILCLDEHRNMESLFWRVSLLMPQDSRPITFNVRRYSRQMMAMFSLCIGRTCKGSLCFLHIDFASLFRKTPSYSFSSSSCIVFEVWSFQKRKLLHIHIQYNKTPLLKAPLMVDFSFVRQESPSISFFFARLGVFLECSGGHFPQVGLFLPRYYVAFRPVFITLYPLIRRSLIAHHLEMTTIE